MIPAPGLAKRTTFEPPLYTLQVNGDSSRSRRRYGAQLHTSLPLVSLGRPDRLFGLVVRAYPLRAEDPGFESCLRRDFFPGRIIPVTQTLALQWLPGQVPGVIGLVLGLVGPVTG